MLQRVRRPTASPAGRGRVQPCSHSPGDPGPRGCAQARCPPRSAFPGQAVCVRDPIESRDDVGAVDLRSGLRRQALACIVLDDHAHAKPPIIGQLIRDSVRIPALVPHQDRRPDRPLDTGNTAARRRAPRSQAFIGIEQVYAFVVHVPPAACRSAKAMCASVNRFFVTWPSSLGCGNATES